MRLFLFLFLFSTGFSGSLFSQYPLDNKRDYYWFFGALTSNGIPERSFINFNQNPPEIGFQLSYLSMNITNASICDSIGNLLFYTNGKEIYNQNHNLIENGDSINIWENGLNSPDWQALDQGCLILPDEANSEIYYLVHEPVAWSFELNYIVQPALLLTTIDMQANNGLGKVISKNQIITEQLLDFGKITATRHANGRDWWILVAKYNTNEYLRVLFDPTGFHVLNPQVIGNIIPSNAGQAVFSPDGTKYARVCGYNYETPDTMIIFDFDRCTGMLSNPVFTTKFDSSGIVGVAISPNSRYLYWTSNRYIFQYDLQAPDVLASKTTVAVYDGFQSPLTTRFFMAQLAPDGKIYINTPNGTDRLHVIEHPDKPGLACSVCQHCIQLPAQNFASLPNFPNYRLGPLDGSPCDTLGLDVAAEEEELNDEGFAVKLSPNPADAFIHLEFTNSTIGASEWSLYDGLGRRLHRSPLAAGQANHTVSLPELPPGLYFWSVAAQGAMVQGGKLIISK